MSKEEIILDKLTRAGFRVKCNFVSFEILPDEKVQVYDDHEIHIVDYLTVKFAIFNSKGDIEAFWNFINYQSGREDIFALQEIGLSQDDFMISDDWLEDENNYEQSTI